jgi:hypothetical protein
VISAPWVPRAGGHSRGSCVPPRPTAPGNQLGHVVVASGFRTGGALQGDAGAQTVAPLSVLCCAAKIAAATTRTVVRSRVLGVPCSFRWIGDQSVDEDACAVWQSISTASGRVRPATSTSQTNDSMPVAARIAIASRCVSRCGWLRCRGVSASSIHAMAWPRRRTGSSALSGSSESRSEVRSSGSHAVVMRRLSVLVTPNSCCERAPRTLSRRRWLLCQWRLACSPELSR